MTDAMLPTPTVQDAANTAGPSDRNTPPLNSVAVALMPTPKASDGSHGGPGMRNGRGGADALPGIVHLLPTPAVNDMGAGKTPPQWDEWTDRMRTEHGNGNGHGKSLSIEAQRLLPTPTAQDAASSSGSNPDWGHGVTLTDAARSMGDFGPYTEAVARWEPIIGRPAPAPTRPDGSNGNHRLSPVFEEWMMGLPEGWVTDTGIPRAAQMKALGNGVVPQQAALALRMLLGGDA